MKMLPELQLTAGPKRKTRSWGFRFSFMDALVIGVFVCTTAVLWHFDCPLWWILVIATGHFFLFCNVFRIARPRELIWAATFILNIVVWACFDHLAWLPVLLCQLPITAGLLIADMRSPLYHGVFANRLNSQLNDYLEGHFHERKRNN